MRQTARIIDGFIVEPARSRMEPPGNAGGVSAVPRAGAGVRSFPLARIFPVLLSIGLACPGPALAVDGTIPNLSYPPSQLFQQISPQMTSLHLNQPSVYNGYLMLAGNAVHEVWDISNPYAPVSVATMTSPFADGEAESHQVSYGRMADGTTYLATTSGKGVDIWDVTVTTRPVLVSAVELPNINYGDVANAIWGISWQGHYLYLGATTHGLYILDVGNPAAPRLVKTFSTSQLGGAVAGPLFALGNLLVVTSPKDHRGVATVDIGDPENPKLLDALISGSNSYIGSFYGGNAHLISPYRSYDVTTDPRDIQLVASVGGLPSAEYQSYADNCLYLGGLRGGTQGIWKYDISNPAAPSLIGRYVGRDSRWDDQFSCPIGNLIAITDDQNVNGYVGGLIAVQDVNPDTRPPTVLKGFPVDQATNQPLTTRVALSLSEWPELATVDGSTFFVRPVGGQPLSGSWGTTATTLSFSPDAPLLPNSNYEIVVPAGGIRDFVGNPIASEFKSTFRTGSGVTGFSGGAISPVPPTRLGDPTEMSVAGTPEPGVSYTWDFGDGATDAGTLVSHTYSEPGRYTASLHATALLTTFEAENATLAGGVVKATHNAGYQGTGYVDFPGGQGSSIHVRWAVNSQSAGTVDLQIRYACEGLDRALDLVVNGGTPVRVACPATGLWVDWEIITIPGVPLVAGSNTIELRATAGTAGPNIDSLSVPLPDPETVTTSFTHIVHRPLTANQPTQSQPMALDATHQTLWVVNPDSGTVTAVDTGSLATRGEYAVGQHPESLAVAPDGTVWIACAGPASVSVLGADGQPVATLPLPYASQPYGLVLSPDGGHAFVTLQALGRVVKIDTTSREVTGELDLPSDPDGIRPQVRGIAVSGDGSRLFVTRFLSPADRGEVYEVDPASMSLTRTIALATDPGPDTPLGARGVPNYLNALAISPDGARAWLPSKKDNTLRGSFRDGNALNHDMTVRCITSVIDPAGGVELAAERIDHDNRDRAHAVCFSPLGDLAFVSMPGNNHVEVVDTYSGQPVAQIPVGKAPTGVLLDVATRRLHVLNFLSRSISTFDVGNLINGNDSTTIAIGEPVSLVAAEPLAPSVLRGKQLFYDATSVKLNEEAYMSCASCHLDGSHDGRVWDFTNLGEGLRNTIDLRGRAGTGHGRLHWSANFDEVQDFEGQIRGIGSGSGLLDDVYFDAGDRSHPLGLAKHGLSEDLDALAEYVASLDKVPDSPFRNGDGSLTADAVAGRQLFHGLGCHACHGGETFTDSPRGSIHDVGTLKASSGQRLGGPLAGLDTPTLRGLWATAPYLHDGSAATLRDVITTANPNDAHGVTSGLTPAELDQLVAYLNQIDETEPAAAPAVAPAGSTFADFVAAAPSGAGGSLDNPDHDALNNLLEYALGATDPMAGDSNMPLVHTMPASPEPGDHGAMRFTYLRRSHGYWEDGAYRSGDLEYRPQASTDMIGWNLPVVEVPNPVGLLPAPAGYEWATFALPSPALTGPTGFGRVRVELK